MAKTDFWLDIRKDYNHHVTDLTNIIPSLPAILNDFKEHLSRNHGFLT